MHLVEGLIGSTVRLRSSKGKVAVVMLTHLIAAEGFSVVNSESDEDEDGKSPTFLDNVPDDALHAAKEILGHLFEVETGYRSGNDQDRAKGEPRPEYDPERTTKTQRYRSKAAELQKGVRTLWDWKRHYAQRGLYGLVDLRTANFVEDRVDNRVKGALEAVLSSALNLSSVSLNQIGLPPLFRTLLIGGMMLSEVSDGKTDVQCGIQA